MKSEIIKKSDLIEEENYFYSPAAKDMKTEYSYELEDKQRAWVVRIFNYRWFYMSKEGVLGVFGIPDCVQDLFDNTTYYQNSCDQDYSFDTWKGIDFLEDIAEKWKNVSAEEIKRLYNKDGTDWDNWHEKENEEDDINYYRRSMCYDEIWDNYFESKLWSDEDAVYISLFREYDDLTFIKCFAYNCFKKYLDWKEQVRKEIEEENKKNAEEKENTSNS